MVKVVGKDPAAVKRKTCKGCASILEYTSSEVKTGTFKDYGGGSDTYHWIVCPECNTDVNLNYKER